MSQPRILITGVSGLLGPYLAESVEKVGKVAGLSRSAVDYPCDITNETELEKILSDFKPDIVLHAAAMTDVDICQSNPEKAKLVNFHATKTLSKLLPQDVLLVFYSSIAVYPNLTGPHIEGKEAPVNVYGQTKLWAEKEVLKRMKSLVFRTTLIGHSKNPSRISLTDFIINNLNNRKPITLFSDILFSPLHVTTLSDLTTMAICSGLTGVYNAASKDGITKSEFGLKVAKKFGLNTDSITIESSEKIKERAPRSIDSRLDVSLIEKRLNLKMPSVMDEIDKL